MGMISEFKAFAMRGNVLDMAVGIIIGAAFGGVISSLVADVIMPPIGYAMDGIDFSKLGYTLSDGGTPDVVDDDVVIKYGVFVNAIINFLIVAFAVFMLVKGMNTMKKKEEDKPAPPKNTKDQELLVEIRDLLKKS